MNIQVLYTSPSTDPAFNLALEETLTRHCTEPCLFLWQNAPSIIVGRHQHTAAEIDEAFVHAHGIPVVRRITGGGAVYHDLGNINFSIITLERSWGNDSAQEYTAPIRHALNELGLPTVCSGRNDLLAEGLKISGCARCVPRDRTLFHGTLLVDANLDVLAQALRPDPEKIRSKGLQSVRSRVGNIRRLLQQRGKDMTTEEFFRHLKQSISCHFGNCPFTEPPSGILQQAEQLAQQKYRTWEWNFGTTMEYAIKQKMRFAGGIIQAELNVTGNAITDIRLTGDFFGIRPLDDLLASLIGQPPRRSALCQRLQKIPVNDFISGLTAEQLSELLAISD